MKRIWYSLVRASSTKRADLALGEVAHRDRVDLDRADPFVGGDRLEAAEDLRQGVTAGDLEEAVAGEGVDRDVDPADPGLDQGAGVTLQQVAVGRHREVPKALDRRQHRDQTRELLADQGLATGQPYVLDPEPDQQGHEAFDLLEREHLVTLEPGQPVGRHAVLAAEVAAIGDRDAQVGDRPAVGVDQRFNLRLHPHS